MGRIVIVQPYVPSYRQPFFEKVIRQLADHGHEAVVATGRLRGVAAARGDAATAPWHIERRGFSLDLRGRHFRSYASWLSWSDADAIVLELATGSLDTYMALLGRGKRRVALWGHVGAHTAASHPFLERLESWQIRRADRIFAYTPSGRDRAVRLGSGEEATVSLNNTVDLSELERAISKRQSGGDAPSFSSLDLTYGKTFAYIGGLDSSKRIGFLVDVLDELWNVDPEIKLLVGGAGADASRFDLSVARGQTDMLGRVGNEEKAYLGEVGTALLNPGRVGLVAVESLTLGLPIFTTDWPYHAPEFEYLSPGHDSVVVEDSVTAYAAAILSIASSPEEGARLRRNALARSGWPSMADMVNTFVAGCLQMLDKRPDTGVHS